MTVVLSIWHSQLDILPSIPYSAIKGGGLMATETLGNRLKVARAECELTQEQLAGLVGVTRQTISAIETGLYCPSALLAFRLAKQLEKRVDELFFLKGETL
jgi:putative transcriptional regulator